jgi:hypothetical protein
MVRKGVAAVSTMPTFAQGLCDDAAVFPPGLAPLSEAVPAHLRHRAASYRELVGPLVLAAPALDELAALLKPSELLDLTVTAPEGPAQAAEAVAAARTLPVDLQAVEIVVPSGMAVREFVDAVAPVIAEVPAVFVEVPRDERRADVIAACAKHGYRAKFRTGGVRPELYPDPAELAAAIAAVVGAGVPFKATAGLHHAIRNTDPQTGFEQHGFLNVLLAADAALAGADEAAVAGVLAERDADRIAAGVRALDDVRVSAARGAFLSFGTCSITEPLAELVELELVPAALAGGEGVNA